MLKSLQLFRFLTKHILLGNM